MRSKVYELNRLGDYKYVVVIVKYNDRWLLCKHKTRETWETAGGHIEENETPLDAARRELYEETGAIEFDMIPLFDYWASDDDAEANGMVFYATVTKLGSLPQSEMERISSFDELPSNLTYPIIYEEIFKAFELNHHSL